MLDLKGRAAMAMVRWGPGVHRQPIWNYRHEDGAPVSHQQLLVLVELDLFDDRLLDPQQGAP